MVNCIGGVILYDETMSKYLQKNKIPELIKKMGSYPGIKVDTGAKSFSRITRGKDN